MTLPDQMKVIFGLISVNLLIGAQGKKVFMDKYGDCTIREDYELDDYDYTILHKGGGIPHERLICDMTFRAKQGHGICITFEKFEIEDCNVKLKIFDNNHGSGRSWNTLGCNDPSPKQMCTAEQYVTLILQKRMLNNNRFYSFTIQVKEIPVAMVADRDGSDSVDPVLPKDKASIDGDGSDNGDPVLPKDGASIDEKFTGEDVFFASLGIFVAIIVGVIVLIISIAVLIICCCCKGQRRQQGQRYQTTSTSPPAQAQPSAPPPPAPTEYFASQAPVSPLYPPLPQYHHREAPPPYTPQAPSYAQQGYAPQSSYTGEPETKQPVV